MKPRRVEPTVGADLSWRPLQVGPLRVRTPALRSSARVEANALALRGGSRFNRAMLNAELITSEEKESNALMIVLHGLGDSAAGYHWMPEAMQIPWMNYLLVNAPDSYYGGYSWYEYAGNPAPGVERSRQMLLQLLEQTKQRGYPAAQTTLFGFSQGCLMTIDVGFRCPDLLAGLVGVSGYVHEPERLVTELSPPARSQRMLFTHGTQDPMIPYGKVREQVNQLTAAGLNIVWKEYPKVHTISEVGELAAIREFVLGGYAKRG